MCYMLHSSLIHSQFAIFSLTQSGWFNLLWGHTIARDRTDMMDVAWGLYARSASAVASSTHQPQGEGENAAGREGGQRYKPDQPFSSFRS